MQGELYVDRHCFRQQPNPSRPAPFDVRLPEGVHKVDIRVRGHERIIAPLGHSWDSFFLGGPPVTADFLPERASQHQSEREAL